MVVKNKKVEKQRKVLMETSAKLKEGSEKAFKINELVKLCSNCDEIKAISEFGKRTKSRDGYQGQCKACVKAKRLARIGTAAVSVATTAAVAEVTDKVNEVAEDIRDKAHEVVGTVQDGAEDVLGAVGVAADAAGALAGTVTDTVETVEEAVEEVQEAVEEVKEAVEPAVGVFKRFFGWLGKIF